MQIRFFQISLFAGILGEESVAAFVILFSRIGRCSVQNLRFFENFENSPASGELRPHTRLTPERVSIRTKFLATPMILSVAQYVALRQDTNSFAKSLNKILTRGNNSQC